MTTIKELKELDQKATSAPWGISHRAETAVSAKKERGICSTGGYSDNRKDPDELRAENKANAELITATRNALPNLIRVIELADEALLGVIRVADRQTSEFDRVHQALSEIRKIKGE